VNLFFFGGGMSDTSGAHSVKSIDALRRGLDVMLAIQRS